MAWLPATGSTGAAPDDVDAGGGQVPAAAAAQAASGGAVATSSLQDTAVVEQYGDLHEYGLCLGVDLDTDDEDLLWAVREAFNAPLPGGWTEYMDDTGRAYYIKDGSMSSTWEHPMDSVYRELFEVIKTQRSKSGSEAQREEAVTLHLKEVHHRARADLEGWSGPYPSEQGEYYYNEGLKLSSWDSPVAQWESELALRHNLLARYLLPERFMAAPRDGSETAGSEGSSPHLLQALRLQLGNLHFAGSPTGGDTAPEPSTSRSFHTARSQGSSRSGRNKHLTSPSDGQKERKEKKSHRHHRSSEERRAEREARLAAALGGARLGSDQTYAESSAVAPPVTAG